MWPTVDICAPAEDIFSAYSNPIHPDYRYHIDTGTSFAAPHVTGIIALGLELLKRQSVKYTPIEITDVLRKSAKYIDDGFIYQLAKGYDPDSYIFTNKKFINKCAFGSGLIQAQGFLDLLAKKSKAKIQ